MTWTKTGSEFGDDAYNVELSDAAYRTHHEAITYLYNIERTDCYVRADEVRRFAGSPHADMAVAELVSLGWWRISGQGYEVIHHGDVIRRSIVAQQRKLERDKKAATAYRRRTGISADVSADVSADADRQTDKQTARTGSENYKPWPDVEGVT